MSVDQEPDATVTVRVVDIKYCPLHAAAERLVSLVAEIEKSSSDVMRETAAGETASLNPEYWQRVAAALLKAIGR